MFTDTPVTAGNTAPHQGREERTLRWCRHLPGHQALERHCPAGIPGRRHVSGGMTIRYSSLAEAGIYFGVDAKTIRNWAGKGKFRLYELPGGRTKRVRIDEIEAALRVVPTARRTGYKA